MLMQKDTRIYVAGHRGLAGSAILRRLQAAGYNNLLTRSHAELDLTDQEAVARFFASQKPHYVFLAAARVGGIYANETYPAEFIHQNLAIQINVIHQSYLNNVRRLIFLGSSCIYPKYAPQPIEEARLMTGPLEPTNAPYAVAKISGIEMCWAYNRQYGTHFIPLMPTNLYGLGDNFDLLSSHVLPALLRKFHLANLAQQRSWPAIDVDESRFGPIPDDFKQTLGVAPQCGKSVPDAMCQVTLWGSGTPRREFLFADDLGDASLFVMNMPWQVLTASLPDQAPLLFNVGSGSDQTIADLALLSARITGYSGAVKWDASRPDGPPQKLLDVSRLQKLGWQASTPLQAGLQKTYAWYLAQTSDIGK